MIKIYFFIALLISVLITASDPFFGTDLSWSPLPKETSTDVKEVPWRSTTVFKPYLDDYDDRVSNLFKISPYYYSNVHFWFLIYTQFESSSVVFHDKSNLSIIYKVLDFSSLHKKEIPKNAIYVIQNKISDDKISTLKKQLYDLVQDPFSLTLESRKIYQVLKEANVSVPVNKQERSKFFLNLKNNLRSQTGQKNFIRDGVMRSLPYQDFLGDYFVEKNLPKELLSIPFLESSFNPKAHSKVNALGVWQFMPLIASYFVPKRSNTVDYRSNIGVSSLAASFLLAENFKIMRSWDLAVTAYNSGTKHLVKTKRELARPNVNLEDVIKHSDSEHFGFASKNFYSEFLALAHTLAYREELFDDLHDHDRPDLNKDLRFYLTKCSLKLNKLLSESTLDDVLFHNHQIKDINTMFPRGFILTTKSSLPSAKFFEIPKKALLKEKPIDWMKLLKNQSCSTR